MGKSNRHDKFVRLRAEFPVFVYEGYDYRLGPGGLHGSFIFRLGAGHRFTPAFYIPRHPGFLPDREILPRLPALVFHIGLIELLSYWKSACPPLVNIECGALMPAQAAWWKQVYYNGLGEFFYLNGIDPDTDKFMEIAAVGPDIRPAVSLPDHTPANGILIPVGGGKDSVVTLELLGSLEGSLPLAMNPTRASKECIRISGYREDEIVEIRRTIDPLLLQLNQEGFLNGHTPFSALLAFYSLLAAALTGKQYIALSNESSANEPTIPGTNINHQYSKSYEFERLFRQYVSEWLPGEAEYFSFLRPLHEIGIAGLFSRYSEYHPVFRSCNAGSRDGIWCGTCSKCLFTWLILSPFLSHEELTSIFGRVLPDDPALEPLFDQLTGNAAEKPFDCVGTVGEVNEAVRLAILRYGERPLPYLFGRYRDRNAGTTHPDLGQLLAATDLHHVVPPQFMKILTDSLNG